MGKFDFPQNGQKIEDIVEAFFNDKIDKDIEMSSFVNEDGELIGVVLNRDNEEKSISFRTQQANGWVRVNTYYENGVYDETYERRT